jgi:hypothetical protein
MIIGLVYDAQRHFQQYFSYIVAVSFIGGGHRSTFDDLTGTFSDQCRGGVRVRVFNVFQQYFSFIDGENWKKTQTCRKSLTYLKFLNR